jgi:hypothetical protein
MRKRMRAVVRRTALVAALAVLSHALLPYLHLLSDGCAAGDACSPSSESRPAGGAPTHSPDCAVCGALSHAGARSVDVASAPAVVAAPIALARAPLAEAAFVPAAQSDFAWARGPPALALSS